MKSIDSEITAVEERIATRKVAMRMTAQAAKTRTKQALVSPPALVAAAVVGFVVAGLLWRKSKHKPRVPTVERRRPVKEKEHGKLAALGTLAMTGATWWVRSNFGGPVGLANFVLEKLRSRSQTTGAPAQIAR